MCFQVYDDGDLSWFGDSVQQIYVGESGDDRGSTKEIALFHGYSPSRSH